MEKDVNESWPYKPLDLNQNLVSMTASVLHFLFISFKGQKRCKLFNQEKATSKFHLFRLLSSLKKCKGTLCCHLCKVVKQHETQILCPFIGITYLRNEERNFCVIHTLITWCSQRTHFEEPHVCYMASQCREQPKEGHSRSGAGCFCGI